MTETGYLTTHVLDTAQGCPAAGMEIALFRIYAGKYLLLKKAVTNSDGRTDTPILATDEFELGTYELVFSAGDYLERTSVSNGNGSRFLSDVPIRFGVDDVSLHYHVPLLISPFGYSTYRGS